MIRVVVADDHPVVLRGIKHILGETPDILVVAEAVTGQEVLDKIGTHACDAIVLDLSMPGCGDGLDLLKELKHERPDIPILVLSMHSEDQFAIRTLKAGASGYLVKESAADRLVEAVRTVAANRKYISPALAERLVNGLRAAPATLPHECLSDREYHVLRLIAGGRTVSEVARELSLSVKTISTYRSRILNKMRLRTNAELVVYAVRNHLPD